MTQQQKYVLIRSTAILTSYIEVQQHKNWKNSVAILNVILAFEAMQRLTNYNSVRPLARLLVQCAS